MESGTGYRFHPTDEELVNYYLRLKMLGRDDEVSIIPAIDVSQYEPWELPGKAKKMSDNPNDQVWYFFCARSYKYTNSQRVNRKTKTGFWKATGKDRKAAGIGVKKTLIFYQGPLSDAVKTDWVLHEYSATFDFHTTRDFVICELKNKSEDSNGIAAIELEQGQSSNQTQNQNYDASDCGYNKKEDDFDQIQAYMEMFDGYKEEDYNLNSVM